MARLFDGRDLDSDEGAKEEAAGADDDDDDDVVVVVVVLRLPRGKAVGGYVDISLLPSLLFRGVDNCISPFNAVRAFNLSYES